MNERVGEQELVERRHHHRVQQPEAGAGNLRRGFDGLGPDRSGRCEYERHRGDDSPDQGGKLPTAGLCKHDSHDLVKKATQAHPETR
jgi:hypothetical protein